MVKNCLVADEMKNRLNSDSMIKVLNEKEVKRGKPSEPYEITWKIKEEYR